MKHSDDVSIRKFREPDLCQLVRLIRETIGISYAEVYPPGRCNSSRTSIPKRKLQTAARSGQPLLSKKMGNWWLPAVWSVAKYSPCSFIQDCKKAVEERRS